MVHSPSKVEPNESVTSADGMLNKYLSVASGEANVHWAVCVGDGIRERGAARRAAGADTSGEPINCNAESAELIDTFSLNTTEIVVRFTHGSILQLIGAGGNQIAELCVPRPWLAR